jgi:hypothetical protein
LGRLNVNRLVADFGRFFGCGTITPWRVRIRQTVEHEGTSGMTSRCSAMTIDYGP